MEAPCPCGSKRPFDSCCGPFLAGRERPSTAAALMRSRYTAYCLKDAAYLLKTWHPKTRPAALDFTGDETEWAGLAVLREEAGGPEDSEGRVEFAASHRQAGRLRQLRENSRFLREAGEWLYLDGLISPEAKPGRNDRPVHKTGRNDPCPCGSGKKHKKCCG